jgi:hypothetical protein
VCSFIHRLEEHAGSRCVGFNLEAVGPVPKAPPRKRIITKRKEENRNAILTGTHERKCIEEEEEKRCSEHQRVKE